MFLALTGMQNSLSITMETPITPINGLTQHLLDPKQTLPLVEEMPTLASMG